MMFRDFIFSLFMQNSEKKIMITNKGLKKIVLGNNYYILIAEN